MISARRPSLKLGTHSTNLSMPLFAPPARLPFHF
jgi:hypothetical protein